jgi:hypothetical protein
MVLEPNVERDNDFINRHGTIVVRFGATGGKRKE